METKQEDQEEEQYFFNAFPFPYAAESIILLPWKCF